MRRARKTRTGRATSCVRNDGAFLAAVFPNASDSGAQSIRLHKSSNVGPLKKGPNTRRS